MKKTVWHKHITLLEHIKQMFQSHFVPSGRLSWQNRDQMWGNYRPFCCTLKGFLCCSVPFRQGLNWSKIIAVMSKGNLPQTEAGSSEAVAPGKAELLSFLKCQRGTGTGNTSTLWAQASCCSALTSCCPKQTLNSRDWFPICLKNSPETALASTEFIRAMPPIRSHFTFIYLVCFPPHFTHEAWINTDSDNTLKSHGWALRVKRRKTWHKRTRGDLWLSQFFCNPGSPS